MSLAAVVAVVVDALYGCSCSFGDDDAECVLKFGRIATGCCNCKNDGLIGDEPDVPLFNGHVNGVING